MPFINTVPEVYAPTAVENPLKKFTPNQALSTPHDQRYTGHLIDASSGKCISRQTNIIIIY